jgi:cohesin complex subunit SCC1
MEALALVVMPEFIVTLLVRSCLEITSSTWMFFHIGARAETYPSSLSERVWTLIHSQMSTLGTLELALMTCHQTLMKPSMTKRDSMAGLQARHVRLLVPVCFPFLHPYFYAYPSVASPLTDVPLTPPPFEDLEAIPDAVPPPTEKAKRKMKDKKQIIDSVTELQNGIAAAGNRGRAGANANPLNTDVSNIISAQHFLPRSAIVMRLLEIRDDPVTYFLPTAAKGNSNLFSAAPPGLAPELADLFMRPVPGASAQKRKGTSPGPSPSKRARRDEVEMPRRAESIAPSEGGMLNADTFGQSLDAGFEFADQSGMVDDFQLELPEADMQLEQERAKSVLTDRSRYSSMDPDGLDSTRHADYDGTCTISMFDVSLQTQQTQSQAIGGEQEQVEVEPVASDKHGYSKNTVKALGLIRKELQPAAEEEEEAPETLSFKQMSSKVS